MFSRVKPSFSLCFHGLFIARTPYPLIHRGLAAPLALRGAAVRGARGGRRSGLERGGGGCEALGGAIEMDRKTIGKA